MIHHDHEQGTKEWRDCRIGVPSASRASSLIKPSTLKPSTSMKKYANLLAISKYINRDVSGFDGETDSILRGREMEAQARAFYEYETGNVIEQVGFGTDDLGRFGASPDGVTLGWKVGIESKSYEYDHHVAALKHFDKHGTVPVKESAQVCGQIMVWGFERVDFVLYHPELDSIIIEVPPNPEMESALSLQISACHVQRDKIFKSLTT